MELKRLQVRMVKADKGSITLGCLCTYINNHKKPVIFSQPENKLPTKYKLQHLYLTSNEKIEVGDWYLVKQLGVLQCSSKPATKSDIRYQNKFESYKIIATTNDNVVYTNTSVHNVNGVDMEATHHKAYPKPSKGFVKKYARLGGIDEVDVELLGVCTNCGEAHLPSPLCMDTHTAEYDSTEAPYIIKLNNHNEVAIHTIKKQWSAEEMYLNMQYYMEHCKRDGYVTPQDWYNKHKHF